MNKSETRDRGESFLRGEALMFDEADALWRSLKKENDLALARAVLARVRDREGLVDQLPSKRSVRERLCREEALLTSKDPELSPAIRHDRALGILEEEFDLEDPELDGDRILSVAGGIYKRRWSDLGQLDDLMKAAELYGRGAGPDLGEDAYAHINAAFLEDVLAGVGVDPDERRARARELRERIVSGLAPSDLWWNVASRAEALFGLGRYDEATRLLESVPTPQPWQLKTTAEQLATLGRLREEEPLAVPGIRECFDALLPGSAAATRSAFVGQVGLALSGGGFRASLYHLGVLARLADLDVLRHVNVLSCVSGGSIVGACYWLALRRRLLRPEPMTPDAYVQLVAELIDHFEAAVARDLRGQVQDSKAAIAWRFLRGEKGAMDTERAADALEEQFYRPLMPGEGPLFMDELPFTPADHDPALAGSESFHPLEHNWLRAHKVPVLVLNATTVNTGHAWQFTPTWMGESPWAVHEEADSVPRLEWSWYVPAKWRMKVGRAVAASACVPGIFSPLIIEGAYEGIEVQLVDGGVHDNQGTVSLLAQGCNVLLVSDAAGQLLLEKRPAPGIKGFGAYLKRSMDTLMARIRLANYGDLSARKRTGLVKGLMFLHMKAGLDADPIRLSFSQEAYELKRSPLTRSGVRKDFQQALAELRTDLDDFTVDESRTLMACGYQMAAKAFERDLRGITELWEEPGQSSWIFEPWLEEITATAPTTPRRDELLAALREGSKVRA